jgi:hypothetical protein
MITAVKVGTPGSRGDGRDIREFAAFYGITHQSLARQLGFRLA